MDTWDAEQSDEERPVSVLPVVKNKWEGEDIEDDVVDSWDQEPEEQPKDEPPKASTATTSKKNLKKIGEKFDEKKKKNLASKGGPDTEPPKEMTAEEILADKLERQKLQEEADLRLAEEVFGVAGSNILESKEDYDKLKDEIFKLTADSVKNTNFVNFTEEIIHSLCVHLSSTDLKKLHTWLGNMHIEKSKLEKGEKSKKSKGKGKAKLKLEGDNDYTEYSYAEDFDDFI